MLKIVLKSYMPEGKMAYKMTSLSSQDLANQIANILEAQAANSVYLFHGGELENLLLGNNIIASWEDLNRALSFLTNSGKLSISYQEDRYLPEPFNAPFGFGILELTKSSRA